MKVGHLLLHNVILMCLIVMNRSIESVSSFIQIHDRSLSENKKIEGIMNIDGESYNTVCDCDPISTEKLDKKRKCIPNSLQIIAERDGQVANYDEIKILIGDVKELNFVKISATSFKCLDGRNNIGVLGTPGGDAGEFLLALSVYENLLGQAINLSQNDVDVILTAYLNKLPFEKLYMCTDDMAISHLERELSIEGLNIHNPRSQLIPELINLISNPENIGDLHMKMMLKYPEQFEIRKELVKMFLNSMYKILWNKTNELSKKIELEILTGDHRESAFIEVRSANDCLSEQLAPILKTKNKSTSVFINHIDAVYFRRYQLTRFFSEMSIHKSISLDPILFFQKLIRRGNNSLDNTGSYIAKGLPFYTINLS